MEITEVKLEEGKELYNEIVQRAWKNATFKEQLINNPKTVIKGIRKQTQFPENTKIIVEDQADNSVIYLNIPRKMHNNDGDIELTDEELELVSGGEGVLIAMGIGFMAGVAFMAAAAGVKAILK